MSRISEALRCCAMYDCEHCPYDAEPICPSSTELMNMAAEEIEELMPKEGEWINPSRNPDIVNKDFFSDCSVCGETFMDESNYCPNCGSVMKGGCKK